MLCAPAWPSLPRLAASERAPVRRGSERLDRAVKAWRGHQLGELGPRLTPNLCRHIDLGSISGSAERSGASVASDDTVRRAGIKGERESESPLSLLAITHSTRLDSVTIAMTIATLPINLISPR